MYRHLSEKKRKRKRKNKKGKNRSDEIRRERRRRESERAFTRRQVAGPQINSNENWLSVEATSCRPNSVTSIGARNIPLRTSGRREHGTGIRVHGKRITLTQSGRNPFIFSPGTLRPRVTLRVIRGWSCRQPLRLLPPPIHRHPACTLRAPLLVLRPSTTASQSPKHFPTNVVE